MKPAVQKVQAAMAEHGLDRQVIELEVHARTSQQAADALGVTVGQIVKSLVFTADGRPLLVVASGVNRVDERRLGELAGGRIRRADPDTVKQATGYYHRRGAADRAREPAARCTWTATCSATSWSTRRRGCRSACSRSRPTSWCGRRAGRSWTSRKPGAIRKEGQP